MIMNRIHTAIISDEISQDFETAAVLAKKYGCEALEIRSVWNKEPHKLNDADIDRINGIAAAHGLKICAISSSVFKCDIDNEKAIEEQYEKFEKCAILANKTGAELVRVFTFWHKNGIEQDRDFIVSELGKLSKIAEQYHVTMVVEADPEVSAADADEMHFLFKKITYPNVKVLWDPGNQIYNKVYKKPFPGGYELLKGHIAHVHLKDAVRDENGHPKGVALNDGLLDTKGVVSALIADGYQGYIVHEPHFRVDSELTQEELKLPGGEKFSDGGYLASETNLRRLCETVKSIHRLF